MSGMTYQKIAGWICTIALLGVTGQAARPQMYNLGPTGLIGTISKSVIKVTKIAAGSPADGVIEAGDVIVGVGAGTFEANPRRELATAIHDGETEKQGGKLTLTLKDGRSVDLQLDVLGSYSATAPYDCAKCDAIIERAAQHIINSGKIASGVCHTELLGLMATGEQDYIDAAAKAIKAADWAHPDPEKFDALLRGEIDMGYVGWYWGYNLITLCEYYLLANDESVLPAIRTYALGLARGQDAGGLYGHRMASPKRYGRLPGYAQMNQTSLSCFLGMVLAEKCGIDDPAFKQGLAKTYAYFESFVGRGAFPYGVHGPNTRTYNNNGTSGSAALGMSIKGNREGAAFFSQLTATSYDGLEKGHASTFFNALWTPLGAAVAGPGVTQQFFRKSLWFQTMYREWDGGFSRFGGNGREGDQAGSALLAYCIPRKALYITGKDANESVWAVGEEATTVIERSQRDYESMKTDELLALFGSRIPQVTRAASWHLRDEEDDVVPVLTRMMKEGSRTEKMSALSYFGWKCPPDQQLAAMADMGAVLRDADEDPDVRATAAASLCWLGEAAYPYYGDMVRMVVEDEPGDTFRDVDWSLGTSINRLCKEPFRAGLVKDKARHYKAALKLADHKRQHARAEGLRMLSGMPLEDFHLVADKVLHVIADDDPTYHSYHSPGGPVGSAISVLAELNIREGIQYTLDVLDMPSGKWGFKVRMVAATLPKYGANAKDALKKLQADPRLKNVENSKFRGPWGRMVKTIEGDANPRELISLEAAKQIGQGR